jgi:hypothetical protein
MILKTSHELMMIIWLGGPYHKSYHYFLSELHIVKAPQEQFLKQYFTIFVKSLIFSFFSEKRLQWTT